MAGIQAGVGRGIELTCSTVPPSPAFSSSSSSSEKVTCFSFCSLFHEKAITDLEERRYMFLPEQRQFTLSFLSRDIFSCFHMIYAMGVICF